MTDTLIKFCTALCLLGAGTAMAGDKEVMIASALSAGPASVTDNATVKDHEGNVLRQGSNGFTCYPESESMGPMCKSDQRDMMFATGTAMAGDKEAIIASAHSAGPASVTGNATVRDSEGNVLKQGNNGFTCHPETPGLGAMCNQGQWDELIGALMNKEDFKANQVSFSYMLAGEGDALGVSNSNPYQTDPGAVDDWVKEGPHMMIIVPGKMLKGMSHDPKDPVYVMWGDTPYAHIMVRIAEEE